MFEQAFKNIDDALWKEAGCTTELDYIEQTSWLLFLKYLDGLEEDKASVAALEGKKYSYILDKPYRWERWAAPKGRVTSSHRDGHGGRLSALPMEDTRERFASINFGRSDSVSEWYEKSLCRSRLGRNLAEARRAAARQASATNPDRVAVG